jgi:hypothetical protein
MHGIENFTTLSSVINSNLIFKMCDLFSFSIFSRNTYSHLAEHSLGNAAGE